MSWSTVSAWPLGSMNCSWPVEPTRLRTWSGLLTPGTSTTMWRCPSPLTSVRTCGSETPRPPTRRSMMLRAVSTCSSVITWPVWRLHAERHADPALEVQAKDRLDLAAEDVRGQPRQAERLSGEVDEDRQQQGDQDHPRGGAAPGHV